MLWIDSERISNGAGIMNKLVICFGIIMCLCITSVLGSGIVLTPDAMALTVNRGVATTFSMNIRNDNNFTVFNISFSNTTGFSFPIINSLSPNQSALVSFSVLTQDLFSSMFVSTVSYLYQIPYTSTPMTYVINATGAGFVPSSLNILQNDSVLWQNLLSQDIVLNDYGSSGFVPVSIPALSSVTRNYNVIHDFSFFNSPLGYTGALHVLNRSGYTFAHDSTADKVIAFNVLSVLPSNTLQINLVGSLSLNNNQSAIGYLQIINNDQSIVVNGIHVSANRWVSNFSENDFNLAPSSSSTVSSKLISFIIQPVVSYTSDTNRSQNILFSVTSTNAGNSSKTIPVFINYQNLDIVTINGTIYTINVLGINDTIQACLQHMNDVGFESCKLLDQYFGHNITVIKEIEAQHKIGENDLTVMLGQLKTFGDVSTRLENKMNLYVDKQDSIMALVKNNSDDITALKLHEGVTDALNKKRQDSQDTRDWVIFTILMIILVAYIIIKFVDNYQYFNRLEEACQIGGDLNG